MLAEMYHSKKPSLHLAARGSSAGHVKARLGAARRGAARRGKAGQVKARNEQHGIEYLCCSPIEAGRGGAKQGKEMGSQRSSTLAVHRSRHGSAGHGSAGEGGAWLGKARQGKEGQHGIKYLCCPPSRLDMAQRGKAGPGGSRQDLARQGAFGLRTHVPLHCRKVEQCRGASRPAR